MAQDADRTGNSKSKAAANASINFAAKDNADATEARSLIVIVAAYLPPTR